MGESTAEEKRKIELGLVESWGRKNDGKGCNAKKIQKAGGGRIKWPLCCPKKQISKIPFQILVFILFGFIVFFSIYSSIYITLEKVYLVKGCDIISVADIPYPGCAFYSGLKINWVDISWT